MHNIELSWQKCFYFGKIVELATFIKTWACGVRIPAFEGAFKHERGIRLFLLDFGMFEWVPGFFTDLLQCACSVYLWESFFPIAATSQHTKRAVHYFPLSCKHCRICTPNALNRHLCISFVFIGPIEIGNFTQLMKIKFQMNKRDFVSGRA